MAIGFLILCVLASVCFFFYAARAMSRKGGVAQVFTAVVACAFLLAIGAALLLPLAARRAPRTTPTISITEESTSNGGSMMTIEQTNSYQAIGEPAEVSPHEVLLEDEVQKTLADVDPWFRTVLAGGALALLLVLAYLFLDAGRRGRYAWPLRLGTAVVFAGLCVLLWRIGPLM